MDMQQLTVYHYGDTTAEDKRITLSPGNIALIAANTEDATVNGRSLVNTSVLFMEGGSIDLLINHQDLQKLEAAVGSYCLG